MPSGEADLRAAIERAEADLDGVITIFQALLRIAEIEAGARRSAFAPFDLAPLLLDLADLYAAAAEERGQRLVPEIAASCRRSATATWCSRRWPTCSTTR